MTTEKAPASGLRKELCDLFTFGKSAAELVAAIEDIIDREVAAVAAEQREACAEVIANEIRLREMTHDAAGHPFDHMRPISELEQAIRSLPLVGAEGLALHDAQVLEDEKQTCERCQERKMCLLIDTGFAGENELMCASCLSIERAESDEGLERVRLEAVRLAFECGYRHGEHNEDPVNFADTEYNSIEKVLAALAERGEKAKDPR